MVSIIDPVTPPPPWRKNFEFFQIQNFDDDLTTRLHANTRTTQIALRIGLPDTKLNKEMTYEYDHMTQLNNMLAKTCTTLKLKRWSAKYVWYDIVSTRSVYNIQVVFL